VETLRAGRGYTETWTVTLKDRNGVPVTDVYDGSEPLDLVVCDLAGAALTLSASGVEWRGKLADNSVVTGSDAAALGLVKLTMDEADTVDMAAGPRGLSIGLTVGGKRYECYRAVFRVEPRPTT